MSIVKKVLALIVAVAIAVAVGEIAYRFQWWDFYRTELTALNNPTELSNKDKPTVLVLGDSFTADTGSYVTKLAQLKPNLNFINSGVPGIGIKEALCIGRTRIEKFHPQLVIYQVYVGNDLIDIRKPAGPSISIARRAFWWLTDHLLVVRYLNYKAGQLKTAMGVNPIKSGYRSSENFNPSTFSSREKLLLNAEPDYIENSVLLKGRRSKDFDFLMTELKKLKQYTDNAKADLLIVVVPHCAQVNTTYQSRFARLGAQFTNSFSDSETNFPFYKEIKALEDSHTKAINLLDTFKLVDSTGSGVYFQNDIHLNGKGQTVIANAIANKININ